MSGKKKKIRWQMIFPVMILVAGVGLMGYPYISNYIYEHRKDSLIETYKKDTENLEEVQLEEEFQKAALYNEALFKNGVQVEDPFDKKSKKTNEKEYLSLLNIQKNGLMGYIKIPKIEIEVPIYHGTSTSVLEQGIGHLEGSSLPIGGENTHTVLTGHTGLNRAKLFTDLSELEKGDEFFIYVLNRKLAYEVDQIQVTLPEETKGLGIEKGKDYCTLITCTPYGINSHRLLVRGHRVEYREEDVEGKTVDSDAEEKKPAESQWAEKYKESLLIGAGIVAAILLINKIVEKIQKKKRR